MRPITLGDFRRETANLPDDYLLEVPALAKVGAVIYADHIFIDPKGAYPLGTISLDGDLGVVGEVT